MEFNDLGQCKSTISDLDNHNTAPSWSHFCGGTQIKTYFFAISTFFDNKLPLQSI